MKSNQSAFILFKTEDEKISVDARLTKKRFGLPK
jgi:hypothetical protein